jgi:hypothetical protein
MHWWGGMLGVAGKDGRISMFKVPHIGQVCALPSRSIYEWRSIPILLVPFPCQTATALLKIL